MGFRDGAVVRRERMRMILNLVRRNPGIPIDRIQRAIAWRTGLTPNTVAGYVKELVEVGQLEMAGIGFKACQQRSSF